MDVVVDILVVVPFPIEIMSASLDILAGWRLLILVPRMVSI